MRRLCVTKCKESWNKNKTFNISKFDIRVHKIRMFFITKDVITQIVITKSVNTFYVSLILECAFYFRSALKMLRFGNKMEFHTFSDNLYM